MQKVRKPSSVYERLLKKCRDMTKETFFKIFDSKIQSVLLYSSEIWGLPILECIERVHLMACKRYLGVTITTVTIYFINPSGKLKLSFDRTTKNILFQ